MLVKSFSGHMFAIGYKCLTVAEMGDRLATIDMGRKLGGSARFWGDGSWVPI